LAPSWARGRETPDCSPDAISHRATSPNVRNASAMLRHYRSTLSLVLAAAVLATGCKPMQPFYLKEDGDLSHYLDVATQIEYPDVETQPLDEVTNTVAPLTLHNIDEYQKWDVTLQEVVQYTLCNSQVIRNLGGSAFASQGINQSVDAISRTVVNTLGVSTSYDPALVETVTGLSVGSPFNGSGPEAALSEFDARLDASVFWEKNRRPQNRPDSGFGADLFPPILANDLGNGTIGITKTAVTGTTFGIRNNTAYEGNNVPTGGLTPFRALHSDWQTNFEATFSHPLLQGQGVQYNRIAGPLSFDQYAAGFSNPVDGVVIARIRTDQTLADFEGSIRDLLRDVENNYWELYFRYRDLQARMVGRDSALETWNRTSALLAAGPEGGDRAREAQAKSQYYHFRGQVEQALAELLRTEGRLRYLMGISASDGRLIRPLDVPTTARVAFDWNSIHCESLTRRVEIRRQKWEIKRRELELIAARNFLLPRVDAVGRYRWLGLGDDLIRASRGASAFNEDGSTAFGVLTSGEFQEWQLGLQASIPIGYRRELSGVRHQELLLARERAIMQDLELEISRQMVDAVNDIDLNYQLLQTRFQGRSAAQEEVDAVNSRFVAGQITVDLLLDAQRRRADAETAYYEALVNYNRAIMQVHYRKGSLLEYDGVYLAEGPWPGKAYFDAMREARKRDAATYIDYGYTRPDVFSRGPYQQRAIHGGEAGFSADGTTVSPTPADPRMQSQPELSEPEALPMPDALPLGPQAFHNGSAQTPTTQQTAYRQQHTAASRVTAHEHQTNNAFAATAQAPSIGQWNGR
jgi:outer membrane protein TolC